MSISLAACAGKNDDDKNISNLPNIIESEKPDIVSVVHASKRCILSWSNVPGSSTYTVYWSTGTSTSIDAAQHVSSSNSLSNSFEGLINASTYTFIITSTADEVESAPTDPVSCTPNSEKFINIAQGYGTSYGLREDGSLWQWGNIESIPMPVQKCLIDNKNTCPSYITDARKIFANAFFRGYIAADGQLWMNKWNAPGLRIIPGYNEVKSIATGKRHALILNADGTVWSVGLNEYGQLGATSGDNCGGDNCSLKPIQVETLVNIVMVGAGSDHNLALDSAGDVYTWGKNNEWQLGVPVDNRVCANETACRTSPVNIGNLGDVVQLAANEKSSYALLANGTVISWGSNDRGQLGIDSYVYSITPVEVKGVNDATQITANQTSVVALKKNGNIVSWGGQEYKQYYCCIGNRIPEIIYGAGDAQIVSLNGTNVLMLDEQGVIKTMGRNLYGGLGDGRQLVRFSPYEVTGIPEMTHISSGVNDSAATTAIDIDGQLWFWGYDVTHRLSNKLYSSSPEMQNTNGGYRSVETSAVHGVGLKKDGTVWSWGSSVGGLLGIGDIVNQTVSNPIQVCDSGQTEPCATHLKDVVMVDVGFQSSVVLKNDGTVWTWGMNVTGQLGDGTLINRKTPAQVCDVGETTPCSQYLSQVKSVKAAGSTVFALKEDGTLVAWGSAEHKLMGERVDSSTIPVTITGINNIEQIAVGGGHIVARKTNGTVWMWGSDARVDSTLTYLYGSTTPVQVSVPGLVVDIAAGKLNSMAKTSDNRIWAWGNNYGGQLFQRTGDVIYEPIEVLSEYAIEKFYVDTSSFAITTSGKLLSTGNNYYGQLGDRSTLLRETFEPIKGM